MKKNISDLTVQDYQKFPVWSYFEDRTGNIVATPVRRLPVRSLRARLVGCQVTFRNGRKEWADLSNIDLRNGRATSHFLVVCVLRAGKRFPLARYFDVDYATRGPQALSDFLGLPVAEIFPIQYDIGPYVTGSAIPTSAAIVEKPPVRLSQRELIALSLD